MNIFYRRELSKRLASLSTSLPDLAIQELRNRLNNRRLCLPTEWEVILLSSLLSIGKIEYEKKLTSGQSIDVTFTAEDQSIPDFCADVTAVSDSGYHERNPGELVTEEIFRLAKKEGVDANKLAYQFFGSLEGEWGDSEMRLHLPDRSQVVERTRNLVRPFLKRVKQSPFGPDEMHCNESDLKFKLSYNPAQKGAAGSYPSFTACYSLDSNPIRRALDSKRKKIKQATFQGLKGIIICNGGCDKLANLSFHGPQDYTCVQVVNKFLGDNQDIDFVLIATVIQGPFPFLGVRREIRPHVEPVCLLPQNREKIRKLAESIAKALPQPAKTPENAWRHAQEHTELLSSGFHGGMRQGGRTVKISSRMLVELLAGDLASEDYLRLMGFNKADKGKVTWFGNPFASAIREGRMIEKVTIEKTDENDDWVEFQFGPPDPAITKF